MQITSVKEKIKYLLLCIVIGMAACYSSRNCFQLILIQGDSMYPSYHSMQPALLDRRQKSYTYGDVIAFYCKGLDALLVKRVAAVPGDTVRIYQEILYVNGMESSVYPKQNRFAYAGTVSDGMLLSDRQYFVIGDNIAKSKDSRYEIVGAVQEDCVAGKIVAWNAKGKGR